MKGLLWRTPVHSDTNIFLFLCNEYSDPEQELYFLLDNDGFGVWLELSSDINSKYNPSSESWEDERKRLCWKVKYRREQGWVGKKFISKYKYLGRLTEELWEDIQLIRELKR